VLKNPDNIKQKIIALLSLAVLTHDFFFLQAMLIHQFQLQRQFAKAI
jgi:hypothetical protein